MNQAPIKLTDIAAPRLIEQALRIHGFALLTGDAMEVKLLGRVYDAWRAFFASPRRRDMIFDPELLDGYFPLASEHAKDSPVQDPKEFFHYFAWGRKPAEAADATDLIFDRLKAVARFVLGSLERHGVPREAQITESLVDAVASSERLVLRISNYPEPVASDGHSQLINAEHEDINLITLLPAATAGGLEVKDRAGDWIRIEPVQDNLLVFCGDMLAECSGGYYSATKHRVASDKSRRDGRLSLSFFVNPRDDLYLSTKRTAKQYLMERLVEVGLASKSYEENKR
jgi:isopenicillin N synthase-like dioxygenase